MITIRVVYPRGENQIVLRTDLDWNRDLLPVSEGSDRMVEFVVDTNRTHFYFKPMLRRDGDLHWARGNNYLAIVGAQQVRTVHPHFFDSHEGTVCEKIDIVARESETSHPIRIFLPPGYRENTLKHYPVLYMHDGQNLFFQEEAFAGEHWRVNETIRILDSMNIIRKAIVVGVYPVDRIPEYTRPGYEAYGRYIVEDLKPVIDLAFRTMPDAANTAVMGSSLGGVVSFFLAWQWPEVFGMAACMSSTFGFRDDLMERVTNESRREVKFYLDSGWPEDNYEVTRTMRDLLISRGYESGSDLLYFAFPNALHNERYWALRSHIPFQFFFGKEPR